MSLSVLDDRLNDRVLVLAFRRRPPISIGFLVWRFARAAARLLFHLHMVKVNLGVPNCLVIFRKSSSSCHPTAMIQPRHGFGFLIRRFPAFATPVAKAKEREPNQAANQRGMK